MGVDDAVLYGQRRHDDSQIFQSRAIDIRQSGTGDML